LRTCKKFNGIISATSHFFLFETIYVGGARFVLTQSCSAATQNTKNLRSTQKNRSDNPPRSTTKIKARVRTQAGGTLSRRIVSSDTS
jgi:hypothetical protein